MKNKSVMWHVNYFLVSLWNRIRPIKGKVRYYYPTVMISKTTYPEGYPVGKSENEVLKWREEEYKKEGRLMKRYAD